MVKLYTFVLALTLATSSALAFSDEYERRSELDNNLYGREFVDSDEMAFTREDNELYSREIFDDFEAREPGLGGLFSIGAKFVGKRAGKSAAKHAAKNAAKHAAKHTAKHVAHGGRRRKVVKVAKKVVDNSDNIQDAFNNFKANFGSRELDAEELWGREYELDERDIVDDLD